LEPTFALLMPIEIHDVRAEDYIRPTFDPNTASEELKKQMRPLGEVGDMARKLFTLSIQYERKAAALHVINANAGDEQLSRKNALKSNIYHALFILTCQEQFDEYGEYTFAVGADWTFYRIDPA
jgi:hypothetical protein